MSTVITPQDPVIQLSRLARDAISQADAAKRDERRADARRHFQRGLFLSAIMAGLVAPLVQPMLAG